MVLAMGMFAAGGCAVPEDDDLAYGQTTSAISVETAVQSSCSTSTVRGLSVQIAQEVDCMSPGSLVRLAPTSRIRFSSNAVLPYMYSTAKTELVAAAASAPLTINSGYRTVAQQYLLYRWDLANRCGITVTALPGRSNHESGRAVDLSNWSTRVGTMAAHHWAHDVPGDAVHFDHTRSPDNRGKDIRAFQRLWNRNHPADKISVDGSYGPQTAARLKRSPATGFAKGAFCREGIRESEVVAIDGPDRIAPGAQAHYTIAITNPTDVEWPATAKLVVAGGTASDLYDAATWASASEVGETGVAVAAGATGELALDIVAPQVTEVTAGFTTFALVDGDRQVASFDLAVTITPNGDHGTSGDADDHDGDGEPADEDGVALDDGGGCTTGGSGASWGLLVIAAAFVLRRRAHR